LNCLSKIFFKSSNCFFYITAYILQVKGRVGVADPLRVCGDLLNPEYLRGRIAIMERGDCMFVEKVSEIL